MQMSAPPLANLPLEVLCWRGCASCKHRLGRLNWGKHQTNSSDKLLRNMIWDPDRTKCTLQHRPCWSSFGALLIRLAHFLVLVLDIHALVVGQGLAVTFGPRHLEFRSSPAIVNACGVPDVCWRRLIQRLVNVYREATVRTIEADRFLVGWTAGICIHKQVEEPFRVMVDNLV